MRLIKRLALCLTALLLIMVMASGVAETTDAPLPLQGDIVGTVLSDNGAALQGVRVLLLDDNGMEAAAATTAEDGTWAVDGLEPGSYTVVYTAGEGVLIADDMAEVVEGAATVVLTAQQMTMATLRVQVFNDANNNGTYGSGEGKLAGVYVSLVDFDGEKEVVVAWAETDDAGEAVLHAPEGEYTLRCEMPADFGFAKKGSKIQLNHSIMAESTARVQEAEIALTTDKETEVGIGAMQMAAIMGTVWHDVNGDGLWQSDEPGIPGVTITADGTRNGLHYEVVTDENGRFEIRQIRNGTYDMRYYVPDGYVFTVKASGDKAQRSLLTTEAERIGNDQVIFEKGDVLSNQNIGLVSECIIEGVCFLDANYNGIFDEGEAVLPGVQVELFRQSNNKRLRTVTTDENGVYSFNQIRSDTFKIKVILPTGYTFSAVMNGEEMGNRFPSKDGKREQSVTGFFVENGNTLTVMVGAINYGSITGVVYYDDDFSGAWATGEKLASNVVVTLLDVDKNAIKTAKTNKSGSYTFSDLTPGDYYVSVTPVKGYAFTKPGAGSIVEEDTGSMGTSGVIHVAMGQTVAGQNAGMIVPAVVSGVVFADANDNGRQDTTEKGLTGATVTLMSEAGVVYSTEIKADGKFTFNPVKPGRYYLRYDLPETAVYARMVAGGNKIASDSVTGEGAWFTVTAGETFQAPACGGLYLGAISGYAFADSDGSGMLDGAEQTLAGMTLTLKPTRSELSEITVVTGSDGAFTMTDLCPDTYTLTVTCPEGYVLSLLADVTLPVVQGLGEQSVQMEIGMGEAWLNQALGCVLPSAYNGTAWLDENLNGIRDENERAAAGETVVLIEQRSGSVVATLTTDENGSFRAEGLAPGKYTIVCELATDMSGSGFGDSTFAEKDGKLVMADIAIEEGTDSSGALLGLVRETVLGGHVWLDHNGAIRMVEGAKVSLLENGNTVAECTTGEDGLYTFAGLMPGGYAIHVELPNGHLALEPGDRRTQDGNLVSILSVNEGNTGRSDVIIVQMAVDQLELDIGSVKQGRLGDLVWLDENGDGWQNEGEGGIPGVQIDLMRNGEIVARTVSDQYGYYAFEKLYPGEYTLVVTAPEEVKPTQMRLDMPNIVSVLQENGESVPVAVKSGGANYAADLGFVLVKKGKYPAGYGEGTTQDWTKIK